METPRRSVAVSIERVPPLPMQPRASCPRRRQLSCAIVSVWILRLRFIPCDLRISLRWLSPQRTSQSAPTGLATKTALKIPTETASVK
ncbi:hypothetical protein AAFF_G00221120 [Aldrovandia affinis]|uniref:Uncharacterized protein n=1 Tax=Aldrovandia affinis TaxID=143900 RepID=A0AAD7W4G9_9TELE|nr:hypothetical protein AAFF_G00221120 [Aldrovandia affinis]